MEPAGKPLLPAALLAALLVGLALVITAGSAKALAVAVGGLMLAAAAFTSTSAALYVLVFSMLLSPQLTVGETEAREITLRLEDFLIILIAAGWLARLAVHKELGLVLKTRSTAR